MAPQALPRLLVIGLDGASAQLVFDRFRSSLPALTALAGTAISGELESTIPATTIPAWPSLVTGHDPGELGLYGARQRSEHTYGPSPPVTSRALSAETLWDAVGRHGGSSVVVGSPLTFPPRSMRGVTISCALTPPDAEVFTWPPDLSARLLPPGERYLFDLRAVAGEAPTAVLERAAALTRQRFALLRDFLASEPWRLAMLVDPTLDRLQHRYFDNQELLQRHYALIDAEIGRTLALVGPDVAVAIVSDHGARASRGGFAINDWLAQEGLLKMREPPTGEPLALERAAIDWSRTVAWAEGGPVARLILNVQGREPEGTVEPRRYEQVRNDLKRRLEGLSGPDGKSMGNRAHKPEELYRAVRRVAPDLVAHLGGLAWRAIGRVGQGGLFLPPQPGVSSGAHAERGLLLLRWPHHGPNGRRQGIRLLDLFPTLLTVLGLPVPDHLEGHALVG